MKSLYRSVPGRLIASVLVLMLAACGGGGGASDTSNGGVNLHPSLQLQLSTLFAAVVPGYSLPLTLEPLVSGAPPDNSTMYIVLSDPAGVIQSVSVTTASERVNGELTLTLDPALAVGRYTGTATVSLCSTPACATTYSKVALPYDLILESASNLTTLAPLSGVSDWKTERGDNAHDGYVPVTLDPTKFSPRWILSGLYASGYPAGGLSDDAPVTDSAKHLVVARTNSQVQPGLAAYSEVDGHEIWNVNIPDNIGELALYNGVIYVIVGGNLEALDDSTGSTLFTVPVGVSIDEATSSAPIVLGSNVFLSPGNFGQSGHFTPEPIRALDATSGAPVWTGPTIGGGVSNLATDGTDLYFYGSNTGTPGTPGFSALDVATGTLQWQIPGTASGSTPIVDSAGGAVQNFGTSVERFDLTSHTLAWTTALTSAEITIAPKIVVSPDTVYVSLGISSVVVNAPHQLDVLDLKTGTLLWSWSPPAPDYSPVDSLLVTKNILFVGTGYATYAVDIATHETVWIFPLQGLHLSLSPSGILYIGSVAYGANNPFTREPEAMAAINLQ